MSTPDPLDEMVWGLDARVADGRVVSVTLPDRDDLPGSDAELHSIVVAGLVDLVAEADQGGKGASPARFAHALAAVEAIIPVARFSLYEGTKTAEQHERAARMRGFEIGLTRSWLLPRLHDDIAAYEARIGALRVALGEP
jgi:hypothetical protein